MLLDSIYRILQHRKWLHESRTARSAFFELSFSRRGTADRKALSSAPVLAN